MRFFAALLVAVMWTVPVSAARTIEFNSTEVVLGWINQYRLNPEPRLVPSAVRALSRFGALKDPDSSGVYVGFLAGVLHAAPARAEELIRKTLPLPPESQWALVRAIAYSGHPRWKGLLAAYKLHMPSRAVMAEKFLDGKLPTLEQISVEDDDPALLERIRNAFSRDKEEKKVKLEPSPEVIDTLWGFYFATGDYKPISRLLDMLPWAKARNSAERLTVGSMAKYTLASNASRDGKLLAMLKWAKPQRPKEVQPILAEVIEAADTVETSKLRKEALAAIEDLKRKGPGYKRDVSFWGQVGQGALALGCIGAAVTGHVELGLPCVIGGAASSAALHFINGQD